MTVIGMRYPKIPKKLAIHHTTYFGILNILRPKLCLSLTMNEEFSEFIGNMGMYVKQRIAASRFRAARKQNVTGKLNLSKTIEVKIGSMTAIIEPKVFMRPFASESLSLK